MGKHAQDLLEDKEAVNILFNVVLKKRTVNKPELVQAILGALSAPRHKKYSQRDVITIVGVAVANRKDLVRLHILKGKSNYSVLDVAKKTREYRIKDYFKCYMNGETAASALLEAAEAREREADEGEGGEEERR